jgi:uncharacterized membrane protein YhaH (DUF805 family)
MKNERKYLNLSPKLQDYIEFALSDGNITSNEVELIKRKALEFGDDLDELEMVLQKILFDIEKENQTIEIRPRYGLFDSYFRALKRYSTFKGRASRAEFWYFILLNYLIMIALFVIVGSQSEEATKDKISTFGVIVVLIMMIYPYIMALPFFSLCSRRLHDANVSAWYALIPFYNLFLFCKEGVHGENKYGQDPYKTFTVKNKDRKETYLRKVNTSKIETVGATLFGIGATCHEAIELGWISFQQLDTVNKWLWIIGGVLIIVPRSMRYMFKKK